jgi:hypothetical protein
MARGCALVIGVLLIIALAVWALAIGLWIVGALVGIFSVLGAVVMLYTGWKGVAFAREAKRTAEEVELLAADCAQDLRALEFRWADAVLKRGIGTGLEKILQDNPGWGEHRQRQIESMRLLVEKAPATEQRLASVSQAEELRRQVEEELSQ